MKELSTQIAGLIYKHLSGALNEAEKAELQHWVMADPANETLFSRVQSEEELNEALQQLFAYDETAGWNTLNEKLAKQLLKERTITTITWLKRFAAAAVITGIILGVIWMMPKKETSVPVVKNNSIKQDDKAPGHDGAILILDNGQQLLLDSTANGTLTTQGNVDLTKKNGQLVYSNGENYAKELVYNTMITPKGRQYNLTLSDGTKVWLNAASSMKFPVAFGNDERRVEITGEAYFEVAHVDLPGGKGRKPFIVHVNSGKVNGGMDVQVLGTHFNVKGYDDEDNIATTLLEGKINIVQGATQMKILPGEQAVLNTTRNNELKIKNDIDAEQVIAWKNGRFEFDDTKLPVIMRQINRWYDVEIVYEKTPGDETYGGAIVKSVPLSDVLKMLEAQKITFRLQGNKLFVKP